MIWGNCSKIHAQIIKVLIQNRACCKSYEAIELDVGMRYGVDGFFDESPGESSLSLSGFVGDSSGKQRIHYGARMYDNQLGDG
jgi:hypothetical protein